MATITSLGFSIFSKYDGSGVRKAQSDIDKLERQQDKAAKSVGSWAAGMNNLAGAAVALGPALLPIATAAAGAVTAVGSLATVGGVALGVFGAAAYGAVKGTLALAQNSATLKTNLDKQQASLAKLTPKTTAYKNELVKVKAAQDAYNKSLSALSAPQKTFITSVNNMKSAWTSFLSGTSSATLRPAATAVDAVTASIGKLKPLVVAMAPLAQRVADSLKSWATDGGLSRFISLVQQYGVPALEKLRQAVILGLGALGIGFRQSLPLIGPVVDMILKGANLLSGWAANGGFQRFFDAISNDAPTVGKFLDSAWSAIKKIGSAASGAAPGALSLGTGLLGIVSSASPQTIQAIGQAFIGWKSPISFLFLYVPGLAKAFADIMSKLKPRDIYAIAAAFVAWKSAMLALDLAILPMEVAVGGVTIVIGVIIAILAAVAVAIYLVATRTTWFQTAWKYTWNAVKAAAVFVWDFLQTAFREFIGQMKELWHELQDAFFTTWHWIDQYIYQPMVTAWHELNNGFRDFVGAIEAAWHGLQDAFFATWHWIDSNIFHPIKTGIAAVKTGFDTAMSGIKTAWNGLKDATAAPVRFFVNTVYDGGLKAAWNNTVGKILPALKLPNWRVNFATGGRLRGPGNGTADKIPIMASDGEYMIRAKAARRLGYGFLDRINRYAGGGPIGGSKTAPLGGDSFSAQGGPGYNPGAVVDLGKLPGVKWAIDMGRELAAQGVRALLAPVRTLVNSLSGRFPGGVSQYIQAVANGSFDKLINLVAGKVKEPAVTAGGIGKGGAANASAAVAQAYAKSQLGGYGWGADQFQPLVYLWNQESGWNDNAVNPSSGAYGIPQALGHGHPYNLGDYMNQINWGLNYIKGRYGSPSAAWGHEQQFNWYAKGGRVGGLPFGSYDSGGYLPKGYSVAYNGTGKPEPVGAAAGGAVFEFNNCVFAGSQNDFEDMLVKAYTNAQRKGRLPK